MHQLVVTAVGADRPGIVATVARVLHERGGNLEDSAMTLLGGYFAIVLLVETGDEPDGLREALTEATRDLGMTISVSRADVERHEGESTHLLSVYGTDRPGIVAGVTAAIADAGASITDLSTQVVGGPEDDELVYAMVIELAAPDEAVLADRLERTCAQLDVDHTLRTIDAETY